MPVKWIGAALIIISCGSVGFRMAMQQRKEEAALEKLMEALGFMSCQLEYLLMPVPQLCKNIAAQVSGPIGKVFTQLSAELDAQISPDVNSCMRAAVSKCSDLPESVTQCLLDLGKRMGKFDVNGQLKELESVKNLCQTKLGKLRENKDQRLRSYQTLGLCAGAAIAIIFV